MEILFSATYSDLAPEKGHSTDACWDLKASADGVIEPGLFRAVPTGLTFAMPKDVGGFIWPRSGLSYHSGLDVLAGVIDPDYRGEIQVILMNNSSKPFEYVYGNRIAQIEFRKLPETKMTEIPLEKLLDLDDTTRGAGKFGSTGF